MSGIARHERRWASDSVPGDRIFCSGSSPESSLPPTNGDEELVEVTLDVQEDDTIVLRSIEQLPAPVAPLERDASSESFGSATSKSPSVRRSPSHRLRQLSHELKSEAVARARQISQELKRFSWSHGHAGRAPVDGAATAIDSALAARAARKRRAQLDRSRSGAQKGLRGLRFISSKTANGVDGWNEVQRNFDSLASDGYLSRTEFALCIGMRDSKEFALELFNALSRRRRLKAEKISKEELFEFWTQITDQSFDSRLQIFFDMVDKNEDGRVSEEEVKEVK